jgi:23S rRNA (uridine2552-2'-O)-methyltransferase
MARSKTSRAWMKEHVNDPYVQRAKAEGYRSRAAYKLIELDAKDRLLGPGRVVVDLGATPGGWAQVAAARVGPRGLVIGVDLLDMEPLPGVTFIRGDFTTDATLAELDAALGGRPVDLVLSDMAPNISGVPSSDAPRMIYLNELAAEFALQRLSPNGALVMKTFQGPGFPELIRMLKSRFRQVLSRKPDASRDRSPEMYLLARELRP